MNRRGFMARISAVLGALAVGPRVLEAADPLEFTGLQGVDWGSGDSEIAIVHWDEDKVVRVERLTATDIVVRRAEWEAEMERRLAEFHKSVAESWVDSPSLPTGHRTMVRSSLKGVKW